MGIAISAAAPVMIRVPTTAGPIPGPIRPVEIGIGR